MEKAGALDVYFEATIRILMLGKEPLREDVVRTILDESEVKFTRITKSSVP